MAVYLVDFENVTSAGISGIQRLTEEDKVYIFYTVNASNMSFAAHMNLLSSPAEVIYYNVTSGGKNALDFQLASFLGYLICKGEDKDFYIISNDKGYDHVKSFWERSGIAEGVTIHGSSSINRSLIAVEKPFSAKIQQSEGQQTLAQKSGVTPERLEQMKAEADMYNARRKAAETAETEETAAADTDSEKPAAEETAPANADANAEVNAEASAETTDEPAEEKPVKRRGRPKKQPVEVPAETVETAENAPEKAEEKKAKYSPQKGAAEELVNAFRPLLAKANVRSEEQIQKIAAYFQYSEGKQQFYRSLIAIYGIERGAEVYRVVRTEYTNLTKLVNR
ncbi:MAG: PIN domain-containing protein [Ruminococcus sp.]|nr:PIN domain-containing protein [Ruminococcus sp.]MCM1382899.1 PIN domain-containing protein [Muribaculaceae bacterium]MCM1478995.1 PIN domain-containing protein [Muribaculaceae bacterium]